MNRREFLSAAATIAATAALPASAADTAKPQPSTNLAALPPSVEYFTQERLEKAIDTTKSLDGIQFQTVCYTFNPWHPTPYMEKTFGKGWTEYETMRMARPQFPGHYQPKRPLWGCFNEADPQWAAREIDL